MDDTTARLALPLLHAGQAQKELDHNEALALLDIAVQASVVAAGINAPPTTPDDGACWIVGDSPVGEWSGHGGEIAGWTGGGWRFVAPHAGMVAWCLADATEVRHDGAAWVTGDVRAARLLINGESVVGVRQGPIEDPDGGAAIDIEARAAIGGILSALRAHGLIAT